MTFMPCLVGGEMENKKEERIKYLEKGNKNKGDFFNKKFV